MPKTSTSDLIEFKNTPGYFDGKIAVFDLTIPRYDSNGDEIVSLETIKSIMKSSEIRHYCYQLEKGEKTGYEHYQARIKFSNKTGLDCRKTWKGMRDWIIYNFKITGFNFSATNSLNNDTKTKDSSFYSYCNKTETRLLGPWTDIDVPEQFIADVYRDFVKNPDLLYPAQKQILENIKSNESKPIRLKDNRSMNVFLDVHGKLGKSTIVQVLSYLNLGYDVSVEHEGREITEWLQNVFSSKGERNLKCLLVNIPKSFDNQDKLKGLYGTLENIISTGKLRDRRNYAKEWIINIPTIWIFTNTIPDLNWITKDRWKFWIMKGEKETGELVNINNKELMELKRQTEEHNPEGLPTYTQLYDENMDLKIRLEKLEQERKELQNQIIEQQRTEIEELQNKLTFISDILQRNNLY
jgi:hypothetical protein